MDGIELRDGETLSEEAVICPHCGAFDAEAARTILAERVDGHDEAHHVACHACGGRISVVVLFHAEAVG